MKKSSYHSRLKRSIADGRDLGRMVGRLLAGTVAVAVGLMLLAWLTMALLAKSDFFQIESIKVSGSERFSSQEIVALAGLDIRSNLVAVKEKEVNRRLQENGWIRFATIKKTWPSQLAIKVRENKPVALLVRPDGSLTYMDRAGRLFAPVAMGDEYDLPVVTVEDEAMLTEQGAMKEVFDMLRYAGRGHVDLPKQNISQLLLAKNGDLSLFLADNPCPINLGQGKMWKKYKQLTRVLGWLYKKKKFASVAEINMDYLEGRVLVRFAG